MLENLPPFNIDLLTLESKDLQLMKAITVMDIFDGKSNNFHPNGLFSTEAFGRVGEENRNRLFAYVDLKTKVFHPVIFKALCELKRLYGEIMAETSYAIWNDELKDFEKASPIDGETGYHFFISHFDEIKFEERPSAKREFNIRLVNKYREKSSIRYHVVMPAGLRDFEIDETGKPTKAEINDLYIRLLALTNLIPSNAKGIESEAINSTKYQLQVAVNTIYEYIINLLEGKSKFIQGKWAARRIQFGTRNVITALKNNCDKLHGPLTVKCDQTVIGLYQFIKATEPVSAFNVKTNLLKAFPGRNMPAVLVNMKTLKKELVHIDPNYYDKWMTNEGINKIFNLFSEETIRDEPLIIQGYYLYLIYKGPDGTFKLFQDISELPDSLDKKYVFPITFSELLYISVYKDSAKAPIFVTRYPVIGYGGTYPSYAYLRTTVKSEIRTELDDEWNKTNNIAYEFPIPKYAYVNSMSAHPMHEPLLGADHDGDMTSGNSVFTEESKAEVAEILNSKRYYVNLSGKMNFDPVTNTLSLTVAYMSKA